MTLVPGVDNFRGSPTYKGSIMKSQPTVRVRGLLSAFAMSVIGALCACGERTVSTSGSTSASSIATTATGSGRTTLPTSFPIAEARRPKGTPCAELTAQGCLWSTECVLTAPDKVTHGPYVCRPAQGPCEGGVAQADPGFEADCNARNPAPAGQRGGGCTVRPADCFCPDAKTEVLPQPGSPEASYGVACACGGGPTVQCVPGR